MDFADTVGFYTLYWDRTARAWVVYMSGTDEKMLETPSSTEAYDYMRSRMAVLRQFSATV